MKIAFTGNVFPFSEQMAYGGERILLYLLKELAQRHDIHLFAREGTKVPGMRSFTPVGPLQSDVDVHHEAVKKHPSNGNFDIYQCNYFGDGWDPELQEKYNYAELVWNKWCHAKFQTEEKPFNVITYSRVLQDDFMDMDVETTMIHYGIPRDLYHFEPENDGYAVWIGKVEGGKAPHLAIKLALAAGLKIVLMAPPYNTGCFWEQIGPYLDNDRVFWVRGVDDAQKYKIMSRAKVFIYSNDNTWKEHFGIVIAEALAMGVPVVGFNRINQDCAIVVDGIVHHGRHGYILHYKDSNDEKDILDKGVPYVQSIDRIDRMECREHFEKHFTAELMARRYEWFYENIMKGVKFGKGECPI